MEQLQETLNRMKSHSPTLLSRRGLEKTSQDLETCPICKGDEWILVAGQDGIEKAVQCECRKRAVMSRRLRFADIPDAFRKMTLNTFNTAVYREPESKRKISAACQVVRTYIDDFESQNDTGMGLYIWSKTKGSGKTRMAASIANELLSTHAVKFSVSIKILQEIKNSWRKDTAYSESKLLEELGTAEILIIDDFGVETPSDWVNDKFYQIINDRYINRKVTIFTSNESLDKLRYDDRITNRIKERVYQVAFPEESVREHIAERNRVELLKKMKGI